MMESKSYPLLAIDGGGTKTIAVITDLKGNILASGRSQASNYQAIGKEVAKANLQTVIKEVINKVCGLDTTIRFDKVVLALAGIDTEFDQLFIKGLIEDLCHQINVKYNQLIIENDALSALLGLTCNQPGAVLISGTGSVAYAHNGTGIIARSGGWGHIVGDEGSGYWIGKEAIRAILKMADGRGSPTILKEKILEKLQLFSIDELYNWVYGNQCSVNTVSELAIIVDEYSTKGDAVAKAIIEKASEELISLLLIVMKKADIDRSAVAKIVLQGGVLMHNKFIRQQLQKKLENQFPQSILINADLEPIEYIIRRGLTVR